MRVLAIMLLLAGLPATAAAGAPLAVDGTRLVAAAASGSFTELPTPVDNSALTTDGVSQDGRYVAFSSKADGLSPDDVDSVQSVFVKDRQTGVVELVSRRTGFNGAANDADCGEAAISDDGQTVAFDCVGPLAPTDTDAHADVYVRSRATGATTLLTAGGDAGSYADDISGDGSTVLIASFATNLVAGPLVAGLHIYRRAVAGGAITLVDGPTPNGVAFSGASISDDGTRVAFASAATNLVTGATDTNGAIDVFYADQATGKTNLVSTVSGSATTAADHGGERGQISGNGKYVAYETSSTNIGDGDADTSYDIHRRDLGAGAATVLVSRATGAMGTKANGYTYSAGISDAGDRVTFLSSAMSLDPAANGQLEAYVRRLGASPTTELISRASGAGPVSSPSSAGAAISGSGAVAAVLGAGLSPDADAKAFAVFARDVSVTGGATTLVSRPAGAAPFVNAGGPAFSGAGTLSADGRFAVFASAAAGLPGAPGGPVEIWRRDNLTGDVVLVSRADGSAGAAAGRDCLSETISADGSRVAFATDAKNLGVPAGPEAVYVRDVAADTLTPASRADGALGAVASYASGPAIAADGGRVAFVSGAPELGVADGAQHVFVRDLAGAHTIAVAAAQDGNAGKPRLDGDGSRAVWQLDTPDPDDKKATDSHVWVGDVGGPLLARLDTGAADAEPGTDPTISDDGVRVAFTSAAMLDPADQNGWDDVYALDVAGGESRLVSRAGPAAGDSISSEARISGDGTAVAFASYAANLVAGDVNGRVDAFVRYLSPGTTVLASRGDGAAGPASDQSVQGVATDADGGCVSFATDSTALAAGLTPGIQRVWLRATAATCPGQRPPDPPAVGGGGSATPTPTPTPTATPTPTPTPIATPPHLTGLAAKPVRFRRRKGTHLSFTLDRDAAVAIVVVRGRKRIATLSVAGRMGANRVRFLRRRAKPGRYAVTATAAAAQPVTIRIRARR